MNSILSYLDELIPNPKCELNYSKDYELLIAIMLSAQTTDKKVNEVTSVLFKKYDSLEKLSEAEIVDIENIIKRIGTYHKKALFVHEISKKLLNIKGPIPNNRKFLESLPGVGHKTVNVFLFEIYNEPCIAVDTHVTRVSYRLGLSKKNDSVLVIEHKLMKKIPKEKWGRSHKQLVLFGRYYCKSRNPSCEHCKLNSICSYKKTK